MKRSIRCALVSVLLCGPLAAPAWAANGEDAHGNETPLMVIRFNQKDVDFAMPLYDTLSQALTAKQSAVFDVVSVAPRATKGHNQHHNDVVAAKNASKVMATMHEIGMPDRRIHQSSTVDNVASSEVRIYVH